MPKQRQHQATNTTTKQQTERDKTNKERQDQKKQKKQLTNKNNQTKKNKKPHKAGGPAKTTPEKKKQLNPIRPKALQHCHVTRTLPSQQKGDSRQKGWLDNLCWFVGYCCCFSGNMDDAYYGKSGRTRCHKVLRWSARQEIQTRSTVSVTIIMGTSVWPLSWGRQVGTNAFAAT